MSETESLQLDFKEALKERAQVVNARLSDLLSRLRDVPDSLRSAMCYTVESPGKRIRGAVLMWACEVIAGQINEAAKTAAAAVELVHTYSLIHDDLPAMDDDDLRRGKPTCHKVFGEATAILTGDALLTFAFEVLACGVEDANMSSRLVEILARAAGPSGMVAGQQADLEAENASPSAQMLQSIHMNKTARMFGASTQMGAVCANAGPEQEKAMHDFGISIGLGFQVADDILDVSSSAEELGKTPGKDQAAGKLTYPSLYGIEKSRQIAADLAEQAVNALGLFGNRADILRHLAFALLERTK